MRRHISCRDACFGQIFVLVVRIFSRTTRPENKKQKHKMKLQLNQKAYEELKAATEAEIAAGQEDIDKHTIELADTDERNAQAKRDIKDTKNHLLQTKIFESAEREIFHDRAPKDAAVGTEAMSKALVVLSGDNAH